MKKSSAAAADDRVRPIERRKAVRQKMMFRVAILGDGKRSSICLVTCLSESGVQLKLFGPLERGRKCNFGLATKSRSRAG